MRDCHLKFHEDRDNLPDRVVHLTPDAMQTAFAAYADTGQQGRIPVNRP